MSGTSIVGLDMSTLFTLCPFSGQPVILIFLLPVHSDRDNAAR